MAAAAAHERAGRARIVGVWSHFACSDEPDHPANDLQEERYLEALAVAEQAGLRPEVRHLANSAAAILRPSSRFDLVRCGLASYGLDPAPGETAALGLRPAMTVRAPLALVKRIAKGEGVSYGHTWTADEETTVGLVPVGYGDGVPRHGSNVLEVAVGRRYVAPCAAACAWTRSWSTSAGTCRSRARRPCSSVLVTTANPLRRTGPMRAGRSPTRS